MKRMILYAYSKLNLGDDLFIKILCDRYPNTKFTLFTEGEYINHLSNIDNLEFHKIDKFIFRCINYLFRKFRISNNYIGNKLASKSDGVIYIGGSLFIQTPRWRDVINYNKDSIVESKPTFLLGANFGPYNDSEYYDEYRKIFENYTDICFRENYTYNKFKELKNVRVADDIVFQHTKHDLRKLKNRIIISVIKPSYRPDLSEYDEIYYKKIKEICIEFIDNGYEVMLMSFCKPEGDEEAISDIMQLIPDKYLSSVSTYFYRGNLEEALYEISDSKLIVATRYHSMILGLVEEKPVLPIIYSSKMKNTLQDINFNGRYIEFKDLNEFSVKNITECFISNKVDISQQRITSKKHFDKLDQYLK